MSTKKHSSGWRISEVERLIGLSRRDIQRSCYQGKGGVGILNPTDSSWGRRLYSSEDLAKLFVVKQYKECGYSLPEVKVIFDNAEKDKGWQTLLCLHLSRLREKSEETAEQLARAEALARAVGVLAPTDERDGSTLELASCLSRGLSPSSEETQAVIRTIVERRSGLLELLGAPGVDLAMELQLGPGASDYLREAIGS